LRTEGSHVVRRLRFEATLFFHLIIFLISSKMQLKHNIYLVCLVFDISEAWLQQITSKRPFVVRRLSDDWSSFQVVDDDDEDEIVFGRKLDRTTYATENDDSDLKATVGASLSAPSIERDAEPIFLPAGK
jgi:hypothetical protein